MVHFLAMAQLMDNDGINGFRRSKHQKAVKIQVSLAGAAAP